MFPGQSVTIESQNYPDRYPSNYECKWVFQVTSTTSRISISCSDFNLKNCKKSSVEIEGGKVKRRYCGRQNKVAVKSSGNTMTITFATTWSKKRGTGFSCQVFSSEVVDSAITASTLTSPSSSSLASATTQSLTTLTAGEKSCQPCGTKNLVTRIVGGEQTEVNEYPWQVAIVVGGTNQVFCGGSLLNSGVVLTTASCVIKIKESQRVTEVLLGAHDLKNPSSAQQRISVYWGGHFPEFNPKTFDHDVGVLWLTNNADLSEAVKPACLPDANRDYSGYDAIVTGWGSLREGGPSATVLHEVVVPTMNSSVCNDYYGGPVTENMLCAGYDEGGKDACSGDSGGPLVVQDNGRWVLVGITSWGFGCGRPNFPGVYMKVSNYVDSLLTVMTGYGENNLCKGFTRTTTTTMQTTPIRTTTLPPITGGCRCGRRNAGTRIVGGVSTRVHEYPWQVGLTIRYLKRPFCGGSIISDEWVLTAAHCVRGSTASNLIVIIGEHNWGTTSETSQMSRKNVILIIIHPNYDTRNQNNDIALLQLATPIAFSSDNKIAPVCLPKKQNPYEHVDAIVTGWGTTASGGKQTYELHEVVVPTISNSECRKSYGNYITGNMICAGLLEGGKDSCQGDSGGPMVTGSDSAGNVMIQIGVVSWGYGCGYSNYPGVYTRVANYISWISEKTSGSRSCPRL
ncbi:transmembrane protease serine 9-like [Palaemon carinicauda]|uniref:transmembrane protease serine 9-like n=1 Tax=Palaemon carinicauda TaxID=392227 RepID=UPI0035B59737